MVEYFRTSACLPSQADRPGSLVLTWLNICLRYLLISIRGPRKSGARELENARQPAAEYGTGMRMGLGMGMGMGMGMSTS